MIRVTIKENEPVEKALKRLKKKLEKTGRLKEFRSRQYFTKPSIERRSEMIKAAYKQTFVHAEEN